MSELVQRLSFIVMNLRGERAVCCVFVLGWRAMVPWDRQRTCPRLGIWSSLSFLLNWTQNIWMELCYLEVILVWFEISQNDVVEIDFILCNSMCLSSVELFIFWFWHSQCHCLRVSYVFLVWFCI